MPVAGRTLGELGWGERYGVSILGIQREETAIPAPGARRPIRVGDILLASGDTKKLLTLARREKLSTPSTGTGPTSRSSATTPSSWSSWYPPAPEWPAGDSRGPLNLIVLVTASLLIPLFWGS